MFRPNTQADAQRQDPGKITNYITTKHDLNTRYLQFNSSVQPARTSVIETGEPLNAL